MTGKKLLLLVVALAVVVGIIIVSENMGKKEETAAFFPQLSAENISAIEISDNGESVELRRRDGSWVVSKSNGAKRNVAPALSADVESAPADTLPSEGTGQKSDGSYPADSAAIQTALEKIATMEKDELISQNPDKQEVFEVDSAKGVLVTVWNSSGNKAGSFRVGKSGPDWSSNYVRMIGSDDVYTVRGRIKSALFSKEDRWRDKTIMDFMPEQASKLTLNKKEGEDIALEQKLDSASTPVWALTAPEQTNADQQQVSSLLSSIATLKAADWADGSLSDSAMGFVEPTLKVTVGMANETSHTLTVGEEKDGKMYVRSDDKPGTVFLVTKSNIDGLNKKLADLKAKEEDKPADQAS
ncbi:MAG: DUF4340 domain-containing protein [Chitinivibrionales bacterium]